MVTQANFETSGSDGGAEFLRAASLIMRTLGHPERLRIIEYLSPGERSVGEIQRHIEISQPQTSQHLTRMLDRGILVCRTEGNKRYYSITSPFIHKLLGCFSECQEKVASGEWAFLLDIYRESYEK